MFERWPDVWYSLQAISSGYFRTVDETKIQIYDPKLVEQSKEWKHSVSPTAEILKT